LGQDWAYVFWLFAARRKRQANKKRIFFITVYLVGNQI